MWKAKKNTKYNNTDNSGYAFFPWWCWYHLYDYTSGLTTEIGTPPLLSSELTSYSCWALQSSPLQCLSRLRNQYLPLPAPRYISAYDSVICIPCPPFHQIIPVVLVWPYTTKDINGTSATFVFAYHQGLPNCPIEHAPFLLCANIKDIRLLFSPRILKCLFKMPECLMLLHLVLLIVSYLCRELI